MGEIRENVKRNLGYYLSLRGMSQKDFAAELAVSQAAVTNWIKGKNSPDIETVARICEVLRVSVVDLFGMKATPPALSREQLLLERYRERKVMQPAIDRLLDLPPSSIEFASDDSSIDFKATY